MLSHNLCYLYACGNIVSASAAVTTGSIIHAGSASYYCYVAGDLDGDNATTVADAQKIYNYIMGNEDCYGVYLKAADYTGDGDVSVIDLMRALNNV